MINRKQENHWHIRDVAIQKVGHVHGQETDHHIIEITEQEIRRDHGIVIDPVQHPRGLLQINFQLTKIAFDKFQIDLLTGEDHIDGADLETIIVDVTLVHHHHRLPQRQKGLLKFFQHFETEIIMCFVVVFHE